MQLCHRVYHTTLRHFWMRNIQSWASERWNTRNTLWFVVGLTWRYFHPVSLVIFSSVWQNTFKCACSRVIQSMAHQPAPHQLDFGVLQLPPHQVGFGVSGAEAAAHSIRLYLQQTTHFSNLISRMPSTLSVACSCKTPELRHFVHCACSSPSSVFFGADIIESVKGVQQGDPLRPLLFSLTIQHIIPELELEIRVLYMDDVILGGSLDVVHEYLCTVESMVSNVGLKLKKGKSEMTCSDFWGPSGGPCR